MRAQQYLRLLAQNRVNAWDDDCHEQKPTAGETCPDQHSAQLCVLNVGIPHKRTHWNLQKVAHVSPHRWHFHSLYYIV